MNAESIPRGQEESTDSLRPVTSQVTGASELRSEISFRDRVNATDSVLPMALYRLKTQDMRKFLETVIALTIVTIPTWETQHIRYSAERSAFLQLLLKETLLTALIEQYCEEVAPTESVDSSVVCAVFSAVGMPVRDLLRCSKIAG